MGDLLSETTLKEWVLAGRDGSCAPSGRHPCFTTLFELRGRYIEARRAAGGGHMGLVSVASKKSQRVWVMIPTQGNLVLRQGANIRMCLVRRAPYQRPCVRPDPTAILWSGGDPTRHFAAYVQATCREDQTPSSQGEPHVLACSMSHHARPHEKSKEHDPSQVIVNPHGWTSK